MTASEIALLKALVQWCRDCADQAAKRNREGEVVGFLKTAAHLEEILKNG